MTAFDRAWELLKVDYGVRQSRDAGGGTHRWEIDEDISDDVYDEDFEMTPVEHILQEACNRTYAEGFGHTRFDQENPERILRMLEFWSNETSPYFHEDDPQVEIAKQILAETRQKIAEATQGMMGE